jgi:hypothetical protein
MTAEGTGETLQNWLTAMVQGIVSHPEDVEVTHKVDDMGHLFSVKLNGEDNGKIIGKKGVHAEAVRTLLRCAGSQLDVKASLIINIPKI